ncbi:MAG: Holliday junction resolvase RuvX [Myxococcales bacterium]|nr:Holliday junction resolvase RuvX [Myxococcales bacterium]
MKESRVLGIDYGEKRVGLAISDPSRIFAQTLSTIARTRDGDQAVVKMIKTAIQNQQITEIVIGWPLRLNGREGIQTQKVDRFIKHLNDLALPIHKWDERLSTVSADRVLSQGGVRGKARRQKVDQLAAVIILQAWLDAQCSALKS